MQPYSRMHHANRSPLLPLLLRVRRRVEEFAHVVEDAIRAFLLLGVERKAATKFSFFLLAPTMVAASGYSLFKNRKELVFDDLTLIAVGFLAAFVAALVVVRGLIAFIGRHGFAPFAWYRLVLGGLILASMAFR